MRHVSARRTHAALPLGGRERHSVRRGRRVGFRSAGVRPGHAPVGAMHTGAERAPDIAISLRVGTEITRERASRERRAIGAGNHGLPPTSNGVCALRLPDACNGGFHTLGPSTRRSRSSIRPVLGLASLTSRGGRDEAALDGARPSGRREDQKISGGRPVRPARSGLRGYWWAPERGGDRGGAAVFRPGTAGHSRSAHNRGA